MRTFYISGAITDENPEVEQQNIAKMNRAAERLRRQGYDVINPAENRREGWEWEDYLAYDLRVIIERLPGMYFLKGWEKSRGARLEMAMAQQLDLLLFYE